MPTEPIHHLVIPVETLSRELDAKLLLGCFVAERGFSVTIGSKRDLHARIDRLPPSFYFGKSLSASNYQLYHKLHELGFIVVSTDEEGLVYYSPEKYREAKLWPETLNAVDALLAWGSENERLWREYEHYQGTPIYVTGNPRVDVLRPQLRPYWTEEVGALHERFGRFILLNSNFGKINHYRADRSKQWHDFQATQAQPEKVAGFDAALAVHRYRLFEKFKEIAAALAGDYPEHTLVIRPHPSESHEAWLEATAGRANVRVLHEGNVIPWLLAADVVIHNGCTTGIEAYLLGKPVISYQPVTAAAFDLYLPNSLSARATTPAELHELVHAAITNTLTDDPVGQAEQRRLIDRYITALEGPLASEHIAEMLSSFALPPAKQHERALSRRWQIALESAFTRAKHRLKPWLKGKRNRRRYAYHDHIFPDLTVTELESRIARLHDTLGRFAHLRVKKLSRKIFRLHKSA